VEFRQTSDDLSATFSASLVAHHASAETWERIAQGRGALAQCESAPRPLHENGPIARLLGLLWHEEPAVRRAAALSLSGGDYANAYAPCYGHFAGAFLRELRRASKQPGETLAERQAAVVGALRIVLEQQVSEILSMSNMRYSFLSSALYLALLSTCRDTVEAIRRLRAAPAHTELCRLLYLLTRADVSRKLNSQDSDWMAYLAGRALAALPTGEIDDFWHGLCQASEAHRRALIPALPYMTDPDAAPHLTRALSEQPYGVIEPILQCLGRLGDPRALPALEQTARSRDRTVRRLSKNAIAAIARAQAGRPERTLLRSHGKLAALDPFSLLRPLRAWHSDRPEELLRVAEPPGESRPKP
jgi:hypothetical protein